MKKCGECDGLSYSCDKKGSWICPYCGEDISENKTLSPSEY